MRVLETLLKTQVRSAQPFHGVFHRVFLQGFCIGVAKGVPQSVCASRQVWMGGKGGGAAASRRDQSFTALSTVFSVALSTVLSTVLCRVLSAVFFTGLPPVIPPFIGRGGDGIGMLATTMSSHSTRGGPLTQRLLLGGMYGSSSHLCPVIVRAVTCGGEALGSGLSGASARWSVLTVRRLVPVQRCGGDGGGCAGAAARVLPGVPTPTQTSLEH